MHSIPNMKEYILIGDWIIALSVVYINAILWPWQWFAFAYFQYEHKSDYQEPHAPSCIKTFEILLQLCVHRRTDGQLDLQTFWNNSVSYT